MISLLHQSIAKHATERPSAIAFSCRDQIINYSQLHQKSSQLANCLRSIGVQNLDRIGIFMPKDIQMPVSTYGIMMAGGAYVPIDPNSKADRVEFILENCGIEILITSKTKLGIVKKVAESQKTPLTTIIGIPDDSLENLDSISWQSIESHSVEPPQTNTREDDLAYVMYTSGSTGQPKGLMHTHRSGLAYAKHSAELYEVTPDDVLGNHAPLHFDISTFEFLTGPFVGAKSVLIPEEELMFPTTLAHFIERERLTFWYSVPLALVQLLTRSDLGEVDLSSLRWILFGGEPFPPKFLSELMKKIPQARFCNVYGPAEVNQCTYYHLPQNFEDTGKPIPIGHIWSGATALIVDENDTPVPTNHVGELLISSATMMHGYWARPDLNKKAFFFEEALPEFKQRYYRTGDLLKIDEHGILHFYGRKDRQVKIRGYRLELDEVEAAFTAQLEIEEAVATILTDQEGEKEIVLAIILQESQTFETRKSLEIARSSLPHYGLPSRIEVLQDFPRTPTGKPDRIAIASKLQEKSSTASA
ncbi:amino acid adenylation domain-containing protein [Puniceicoccaceae bacterium K14]|nr:amino acid adenylation domain-containing protein [Puniceicoccaceae bacterium K14]